MKPSELASAIYALYPPFRAWDDTTLQWWTDTVVSECAAFSAEVRAEAFKTLTRVKHKEKPPQPATIFEHCKEAKRWRANEEGKGTLPALDRNSSAFLADYDARAKLATDMCRSPDGRRAVREGWHGMLWAHCWHHRRWPTAGEMAALQRDAKVVDRMGADLARDASKYGILGPKLLEFWNTAMAERDRLAQEIG